MIKEPAGLYDFILDLADHYPQQAASLRKTHARMAELEKSDIEMRQREAGIKQQEGKKIGLMKPVKFRKPQQRY